MANARAIHQLAQLREKNNRHWIALVALAFRVAPNEAKAIFIKISEGDKAVLKLARKMTR